MWGLGFGVPGFEYEGGRFGAVLVALRPTPTPVGQWGDQFGNSVHHVVSASARAGLRVLGLAFGRQSVAVNRPSRKGLRPWIPCVHGVEGYLGASRAARNYNPLTSHEDALPPFPH